MIFKPFLTTILASFICLALLGQDKSSRSLKEDAQVKIMMYDANNFMDQEQYKLAYYKYREVIKLNPSHGKANLRLGIALAEMKEYDKALNYIKVSTVFGEKGDEVNLWKGICFNGIVNFDSASHYYDLVVKNSKTYKIFEVDKLIRQLNYAKSQMSSRTYATKVILGNNINSRGIEYGLIPYPLGDTLYLTTRQKNSNDDLIAYCSDEEPYSNIYYTYKDSTGKYISVEKVQGNLNSDFFTDILGFSADGEYMYVYENDGCTNLNPGDIYRAKKNSKGIWGTPKSIGSEVNSGYWESSASLTADGELLYFVSERLGGYGMSDIYVAERVGSKFKNVKNLGPVVNTDLREATVTISADGNTLYFSSQGFEDNMGGYDVFVSQKVDSVWTKPKNLGYPINSVYDDLHFQLTNKGKGAYIDLHDPVNGMGKIDIYYIDLTNYQLPD